MFNEKDIYLNLRGRLVSAGFEHGAKLRAEVLSREYNCSASTIREALFRLSTLGLVKFQEQRGFRVPDRSPEKAHGTYPHAGAFRGGGHSAFDP